MKSLSVSLAMVLAGTNVAAQAEEPPAVGAMLPDMTPGKPRLFVLSDIGNEPDDQMSFVRLLLYSNEIDIEGIVATTSVFQRSATHPETFRQIVADYAKVRGNLELHARGWPTAADLDARISTGQPKYGMAATGPGETSDGAKALIAAADRRDPRPLWVSAWGGTNTLAQALIDVKASRSPEQFDAFVAKLRVYAISDQDDAGPWLRHNFPKLFYVASPSSQDSAEFAGATWTGISGDRFYRNGDGADVTKVTNEWLDTNIRSKGLLGTHYPKFAFIMEGDTPSYLNLIGNGLEGFRSPSWGGWGGRYVYRQPHGESRPFWTQGGDAFFQTDSRDNVVGQDGRMHLSDQATIWRWRDAFQNDFAARMDWTIKPFKQANHAPHLVVNGQPGTTPLIIEVVQGDTVTLDASGSKDPDGQPIRYRWLAYEEAGFMPMHGMASVTIADADQPKTTVTVTASCRPVWLPVPIPSSCEGVAHVLLAATDNGSPNLTSYRRVVFRVHGKKP